MALDVLTLCVFLVLVQLPYCSMLSNQQFTFDNCDRPRNDVHIIDGAEVTSQNGEFYAEENTDCKMKFKTPSSSMRLLIQFTLLDVRGHSRLCRDNLTLTDLLAPEKPVLLDKFCGALSDLHGMSKWQQYTMYTKGDVLEVHWVTGVNLTRNRGFQLTLTALTQPPVQCPDRLHMSCSNGDCISKDLQCDGVKHCRHGKDEQRCNHGPVRTAFPPAHTTRTSDMPVRASEVYLWIPLMVVVAFTIVLLSLIFIGRRPGTNNRRGYHSARLNSGNVANFCFKKNPKS